MRGPAITDEKIIRGIMENDREAINAIYQDLFPVIRRLITGNSGCEADAEDVFQDALVIIFRKLEMENLVLECSLGTYFYAICRNLWFQKLRALKPLTGLNAEHDIEEYEPFFDEEMVREMLKYSILQRQLLRLSEDCRRILEMFYSKVPLAEIAVELGLSSVEYAKFRKFQCKEILKRKIMDDPYAKRIFADG